MWSSMQGAVKSVGTPKSGNPLTKDALRKVKVGSWVKVLVDYETDEVEVGMVVGMRRDHTSRMYSYDILFDHPIALSSGVSWDMLRGVGGVWSASDAKGF